LSRAGKRPPWAAREKALPLASVSCRNPVQAQQIVLPSGAYSSLALLQQSSRGPPRQRTGQSPAAARQEASARWHAGRLTHMPTRQETSMWVHPGWGCGCVCLQAGVSQVTGMRVRNMHRGAKTNAEACVQGVALYMSCACAAYIDLLLQICMHKATKNKTQAKQQSMQNMHGEANPACTCGHAHVGRRATRRQDPGEVSAHTCKSRVHGRRSQQSLPYGGVEQCRRHDVKRLTRDSTMTHVARTRR
jgi:hypothetical protein